MSERRYMDAAEFQDGGFLQEVNRQILHPLGLALGVTRHDDGTRSYGPVLDFRDDPEGLIFDDIDAVKAKVVADLRESKRLAREAIFGRGATVQPIGFHYETPAVNCLT